MFKRLTEGKIIFEAPAEEKISAKLPVFYNPAMKLNRDITILLIKSIDKENIRVCDLLAGTGIRSLRLLTEIPEQKIESITINDSNKKSVDNIKENIALNEHNFANKRVEIEITNKDAVDLLINSKGFEYIDIDPFGTPNPFLDSAIVRIARDGILAVTATDTSSLAGTFPKTCMRNYWAKPDRGSMKHEMGVRILIRKVQMIGAQHEKAMIPIFSYSKEHYMRVFFRCKKSKTEADKVMQKHGMFGESGPMWLGNLWDKKLVENMILMNKDYDFDTKFLQLIEEESRIDSIGFHDVHALCKKLHSQVPKFDSIYEELKTRKLEFSRTHFSEHGIRCNISENDMLEIIKKVTSK